MIITIMTIIIIITIIITMAMINDNDQNNIPFLSLCLIWCDKVSSALCTNLSRAYEGL